MKRTHLVSMVVGIAVLLSMSNGLLSFAQVDKDAERARLQSELSKIEQEIIQQQQILNGKKQERQTLERDVSILNAEIAKAQLQIRAKNLEIGTLSEQITEKEGFIQELIAKMEREKESLAQLLRRRSEADDRSLVEMVLSNKNFSSFLAELDTYETIKIALNTSLEEIREVKAYTETQKIELDAQRRVTADARYAIEQDKEVIEQKETEKQLLVDIKKGEEQTYEQLIAQRQREAAQIRDALFRLRDSGAIKFEDALRYASAAGAATGVRPALILAILRQESNLGQNVGTCNRPGDPPSKGWREIMKPERDHAPYLRITSKLGRDPETTPLSCPIGGGWGGAMGPSQFIPSTWEMYENRIAAAVGAGIADPWNPHHAFTATATYLADLGASYGGWSAEREAAARYYAGGGWATRGLGYADSVLTHAAEFQRQIEFLADVDAD